MSPGSCVHTRRDVDGHALADRLQDQLVLARVLLHHAEHDLGNSSAPRDQRLIPSTSILRNTVLVTSDPSVTWHGRVSCRAPGTEAASCEPMTDRHADALLEWLEILARPCPRSCRKRTSPSVMKEISEPRGCVCGVLPEHGPARGGAPILSEDSTVRLEEAA